MAAEPPPERSFGEADIGAILKRASEMQSEGARDRTFGLTPDEIARVAQEAGIEPRYVAAAIAELERPETDDAETFWGGPMAITLDRVIPGEVSDETWEAMIAEIRKTFRDPGHLVERGASREWTGGAHGGSQQAFVTAVPCEAGTHLQVTWSDPIRAVPSYVLSGVFGLILIPVVFEALGMVSVAGLGVYLASVAALLSLARWNVSRSARKNKTEVRQLAGRLERLVRDANAPAESGPLGEIEAAPGTQTPLLDLDAILQEDADPSDRSPSQTRQRN